MISESKMTLNQFLGGGSQIVLKAVSVEQRCHNYQYYQEKKKRMIINHKKKKYQKKFTNNNNYQKNKSQKFVEKIRKFLF